MYPDPSRAVFGPKTLSYIENDMLRYLCSDGVMPILIPDIESDCRQMYLDEVDAFVFQGGADISPISYNDEAIENGRWPGDRHRDEYELKLLRWAVKNKKPVLGICRGMQLINVYFGGTLYQDITTQRPNALKHRDAGEYDKLKHEVSLTPSGLLFETYEQEKLWVNSVHHQGVKTLGTNLIVEAQSTKDDLIEAFRHKELPIVGVQWHPEFHHTLENELSDPNRLLKTFLNIVRQSK